MKFLCCPCNEPMQLQKPGGAEDGSLYLGFRCPQCGHQVAMLTNAAETQLVRSLGVRIGGGKGQERPLAGLRSHLAGIRPEALAEEPSSEPVWTEAAEERLAKHPRFVQPVIRRTCSDYARREGLPEITPEVMDAARRALGMG
ncbi:MAG: PCP reductase family protein [Anaerolineae bacterium]